MMSDNWFDSFHVRVSTIRAISPVGHIFKYTPTNGPSITAPSLPRWTPIQVLTEVDIPDKQVTLLSELGSRLVKQSSAALHNTLNN